MGIYFSFGVRLMIGSFWNSPLLTNVDRIESKIFAGDVLFDSFYWRARRHRTRLLTGSRLCFEVSIGRVSTVVFPVSSHSFIICSDRNHQQVEMHRLGIGSLCIKAGGQSYESGSRSCSNLVIYCYIYHFGQFRRGKSDFEFEIKKGFRFTVPSELKEEKYKRV